MASPSNDPDIVGGIFDRIADAYADEPRRMPRRTDPPRPACFAHLTARQWEAVMRMQDLFESLARKDDDGQADTTDQALAQ